MAVVGLFYGSDTGNTENISKMIQKEIGENLIDIRDIAKSTKEDIEAYDFLLFGIPTWYYGESQADWDDFMPTLKEIDFTGKVIGIFGCGDQEDYAEYFCDAMGTIRDIVEENGLYPLHHRNILRWNGYNPRYRRGKWCSHCRALANRRL